MKYDMKRPCPKCPFRTDVGPYLRHGRAVEIAAALRNGGEFACHQTTEPDGESDMRATPTSKFCAGALATMENEGTPNQMMRIAERLGSYSPAHLDLERAPVYRSLHEWTRSFLDVPTVVDPVDGNVYEYEHCGVVGPDCEDPAGFMTGCGAAYNDDEPTCNPLEDCCEACGHTMCGACTSVNDEAKTCVDCHAAWLENEAAEMAEVDA